MAIDTQTLHGVDDLLARLKALPPAIASKNGGPLKTALRKGAVVIQKAGQANLQANADQTDGYVNTGLLAKSVAVGRDPNPRRSNATERYRVFVRKKTYPDGTKTIATARYLEFGTEHQAAKPWLTPAFMSDRQRALDTVIAELGKGIERTVKKLSKGT